MRIRIKKELSPEKQKDILWSQMIKSRDGAKCVICGSTDRPNAHHICPRELRKFRWELDNGITLCVNHHKFSRNISAHQNPLAFFLWLMKNRYEMFVAAATRTRQMLHESGEAEL